MALLAGALLGGARPAAAGDLDWMSFYVSPGVVFAIPTGPAPAYGAGFELTAGYADLLRASHWYFPQGGVVYRHQPSSRGALDTFAVQGGLGPVDIEIGYGLRGSSATPAPGGLHLGATLSVGVFYAGPQWLVPTGAGQSECVVALGIKVPLPHVFLLPALAVVDWGKMAR